jgi:hypothetical protein
MVAVYSHYYSWDQYSTRSVETSGPAATITAGTSTVLDVLKLQVLQALHKSNPSSEP